MRDFTAQMRSPSPEPNANSLSDSEELSSTSELSPPVNIAHRAIPATKAAARGKKGRQDASVRHPDHHGLHHDGTPLAAKLPVDQELVTSLESGMNSGQIGNAQAEQSSALLSAVPTKQAAPTQDAAQQTVSSPERPAHSDKHDACVQSDMLIMPNNGRQPATAVLTDKRGIQTPIGHASPRPLQKALPGRGPEWSAHNASQTNECHSPAQGYSHRHEGASSLQGNRARRQSPPAQWASAALDPLSYTDSMAAQRDALSIFTPAAPDQLLPGYTQRSAQRLFPSPPPSGDHQQLAMQPPEHLPAEQQLAAPSSQTQQPDSDVHRSAEAAASLHTGHQNSTHRTADTSGNPAAASPSAASTGVGSRPAQHTVGAAMGSSSNPVGPATAPPTATRTQAQAREGSAWPSTPAGLPYMAKPSLQSRLAHTHAHMPPQVPSVPQHQTPHLPGEGYAYRQSPPIMAQPAVLHADARGMNRGFGVGQRAATVGAPVSVVQRQQASHGMYGLPRPMYSGATSPN